MPAKPRPLRVGGARVTVFNVGDLVFGLDEVYDRGVDLGRYFKKEQTARRAQFPTQSFLIESEGVNAVVDPSDYARLTAPGHFTPPPGYGPPPTLLAQLKGAGVAPEDVTHVVVTHLHFDHYAGTTRMSGGAPVPTFPKADCLIPKKDWEMDSIADARKAKDPDVAETLVALEDAGKLALLDGPRELGGGVAVEPYPGESPGHQVVGVRSQGRSCYCVGDLFHFREEVEHPELVASWNEPSQTQESRRRFFRRASDEGAVVIPGHMLPGRISMKGGRASWATLGGAASI